MDSVHTISNWSEILISGTPLIDVRAPVEYAQGSLPGSQNLPLMNDEERHQVGLTYKQHGQAAAIDLGHRLVSGLTKDDRLKKWKNFIDQNPKAVLYCFRGGLRSRITQQWLKEAGCDIPLIKDGYKAVRQGLIETMNQILAQIEFKMICGPTGSGKTEQIEKKFQPSINLEKIANHRGSAFGGFTGSVQPSQIDFENRLILELMKLKDYKGPIYLESESRLIGRNVIPLPFYEKMIRSPFYEIECHLEVRVDRIFNEYILDSPLNLKKDMTHFQTLKNSLTAISKKLGGVRYQELTLDLEKCQQAFQIDGELVENKVWIRKLLVWYYDPLYAHGYDRRKRLS